MQSRSDPDLRVLGVVLYYSLFIIISPVITFFVSKHIFDYIFVLSPVSANVYAALAAVVMLHVALGMFIMKAYSRPTEVPEKPAKQD